MSQLARNTARFSALTLTSRLTGILAMTVLAAVLGNGRTSDAYQIANTIPNILYELIIGGLMTAIFIPLLVQQQELHGRGSAESWRVANLLLGTVGTALLALSAAGVLLAPFVVKAMTAYAPDASAVQSRELAVFFFRFFAPQMFFYGLNAVFMAILNAHGVFAITAAAPIVNNLVLIGTLTGYAFGFYDVTGLAAGTTLGIAAMALVQVPNLLRIGMPLRPRVDFRDPLFATLTALALPVLVVGFVNFIGTTVRANLLFTVPGGFTTYSLCFRLIMTPYGIFAVALATVFYVELARTAASAETENYRETLSQGLRWTAVVMVPVALGMSVLAEPLARVLFERGRFTPADSQFFSQFLALYSPSIVFYSMVIFLTRAFYALKDTFTPAWINTAGVGVNIALNFLLLRVMGLPGIALSSLIAYALTSSLSLYFLRRRIGSVDGRRLAATGMRLVLAGAVMVGVVALAAHATRPMAIVLDQRTRAPLRLPAGHEEGNAVVVAAPAELAALYSKAEPPPERLPAANFRRETLVAVFGPEFTTTSTLTLGDIRTAEGGRVEMDVVVTLPAVDPAAPLAPRSAFLLVQVPRGTSEVSTTFQLRRGTEARGWLLALQGPEFLRLALLSLLGAVVYVAACAALRLSELTALYRRLIVPRLGRFSGKSGGA